MHIVESLIRAVGGSMKHYAFRLRLFLGDHPDGLPSEQQLGLPIRAVENSCSVADDNKIFFRRQVHSCNKLPPPPKDERGNSSRRRLRPFPAQTLRERDCPPSRHFQHQTTLGEVRGGTVSLSKTEQKRAEQKRPSWGAKT